jgi:hypothetical protein
MVFLDTPTKGQTLYFISFIHDCTWYGYLYDLHTSRKAFIVYYEHLILKWKISSSKVCELIGGGSTLQELLEIYKWAWNYSPLYYAYTPWLNGGLFPWLFGKGIKYNFTIFCSTLHYLSGSRVMFNGWKLLFFMFWHYRYDMLYYYKIIPIILLVIFGESGYAMAPFLIYKTWWKIGIHYILSRLELLAIIPHGILCGLYYIPKGKHMLNSQH